MKDQGPKYLLWWNLEKIAFNVEEMVQTFKKSKSILEGSTDNKGRVRKNAEKQSCLMGATHEAAWWNKRGREIKKKSVVEGVIRMRDIKLPSQMPQFLKSCQKRNHGGLLVHLSCSTTIASEEVSCVGINI